MSMLDLFRLEAESQVQVLTAGLLELERTPDAAPALERCMRAAHSLKGAARIVDLDAGVRVAHAMEDGFVAAQRGALRLGPRQIDLLLRGVDLLSRIGGTPEAQIARWAGDRADEVAAYVDALRSALGMPAESSGAAAPAADVAAIPEGVSGETEAATVEEGAAPVDDQTLRVLRVTAENLNRLLALAGESRVESRWLKPFADSLLRLKRLHQELSRDLDQLREALPDAALDDGALGAHVRLQRRIHECQQLLVQRLAELENYDRRATSLSSRLYDEALACRMRPFRDGTRGFPRMVRDLARTLDKQVRLQLVGSATPVDRDILETLEAPLTHLLRNAVDHGIETPAERTAAGKPVEGVVELEARHSGGLLQVTVADDGRGIDYARVRRAVVARGLVSEDTAQQLSESELLEFLFLPGFTMKETVTEISGRGVGLDAVQDMLRQVRGSVRITAEPGRGTRFQLKLPLTLSVVRALIAEIGAEPYGFPLAYVGRTLRVPRTQIQLLEGRQHVDLDGIALGLVSARQILGVPGAPPDDADAWIVVLGDAHDRYGLVVDRLVGERELVVQPLDPRLGKVKDIAAGALMPDGAPVLILDVDDLVRSIQKLVSAGQLQRLQSSVVRAVQRKRVLVVDDSLTVRELERKLLDSQGYEVEVAVDGIDGWNAVRSGPFQLVVTDIDMPRLDGIALVQRIKQDPQLKSLPVMIVSYKDRAEDRRRGLEAGADYYLAKGSFHDQTLLQAVVDLIGTA